MKDTIFLNQIAVQTLIGILPHEQAGKQTLILSLALETDFNAAIDSDDIGDALNYAALAEFIETFAAQTQFGLIETFAGALIDAIFLEFSTSAITLTVQKPGALRQTREVGLKMRRERGDH